MMAALQVKQNDIMRVVAGVQRADQVSVERLLERTNMQSVNRMAAGAILGETWSAINSDAGRTLREELCRRKNVSAVQTRAQGMGKLEVEKPNNSFASHATRLWNWAPIGVRQAKTKVAAKREIRKAVVDIPML